MCSSDLSPKVYEQISGHSLEMGMKTYAHLSQDAIIKEMKEKVFEVKEIKEETNAEYEKRIKILEQQMTTMKNDYLTSKSFEDFVSKLELK